jgi:hypothetical protein
MTPPTEWNAILSPSQHWKEAYPKVERRVREHLADQWEDFTTAELVERLYPVAQARGDVGLAARQRLFKALMTLATHGLADCASKSKIAKRVAGQQVYGWRWHASTTPSVHAPEVCPCC